jgi:hypothetical protein
MSALGLCKLEDVELVIEDWLQQQQAKYGLGPLWIVVTFFLVLFGLCALISIINDAGYGEEIAKYRIVISFGVACLAVAVTAVQWGVQNYRRYNTVNTELSQLREQHNTVLKANDAYISQTRDLTERLEAISEERTELLGRINHQAGFIESLESKQESLFRLMQKHQAEAKENVITKLKRLLVMALEQQAWQDAGARVVQFRVEPRSNMDLNTVQETAERITVSINLGIKHRVTKGMLFLVRDPTDNEPYGLIAVKEVHENGSTCEIVEIAHQAFWSEPVRVMEEDRTGIVAAPDNQLVADIAVLFDPELAEQLLQLLSKIEVRMYSQEGSYEAD